MTDKASEPPSRAAFWLSILVALYLLFFISKRLPMTDEGVFLYHTWEILNGDTLYTETHCDYTPLAFYIHAFWMRLCGPGLLEGRFSLILLAVATALYARRAVNSMLPEPESSLLAFYIVAATFPYQCYSSYNNYSFFFAFASACELMMMKNGADLRRAAGAGALAAASFWAKQNLGGLAVVGGGAALLLAAAPWNRATLKALAAFAAGAAAPSVLLLILFFQQGFLPELVDQAIVGGVSRAPNLAAEYPTDQIPLLVSLIASPSLYTLDALAHSTSFISGFLIAVALIPLVVWAWRRKHPLFRPAVIMTVFSPLATLGAVHSPTTWHIIFTKPAPILALGCLLAFAVRARVGRALALTCLAGLIMLHLGRQTLIFDEYDAPVRSPIARGIMLRSWESKIINTAFDAARRVPANESLFIAAVDPMYYCMLQRKSPVPWIYLDPPLVPEDQGKSIVDRVRRSRSWVLLMYGRNPFYDYRRIEPLKSYMEGLSPVVDTTVNGITIRLLPPA